ncbi:PREDICTED: uncharacterized protein LOC105315802 [Amphimedon queenslandica]|nr:PREDICTED: uncharacterized protein LOC105315802 [Amphimedon queenslandica]|eukprot:XP_011408853.1 PREDICTED: uncharacterized protein LOC105315802 [Amphimedon queenslandica]
MAASAKSFEERKKCPFCHLSYQFSSSLSKHVKEKHSNEKSVKDSHVFCNLCGSMVLSVAKLIEHLHQIHNKEIKITNHEFRSIDKFYEWKKGEESHSKSFYVKNSASRMQGLNRKSYYYCNRSGVVRQSKEKRQRAPKVQGSCKTNEYCTAHMTVIEDTITKMVKVTYCSHHSNHKPEVCHLRVPDKVKNAVAAKLAEGVTIERILDDIRDSVTGTIEREHLMNRQDVHNIEYKLNLQSIKKHQNDHSSIVAWVTEMQEMECQMRMIMITSIQQ